MRFAAATIKDSLPHVRRFVAGNLAGGIDHLVVFVDAPDAPGQDEVIAWLEAHPAVTCVRAGRGWHGRRPAGLNRRQCINANAVKQVLAGLPDPDGHAAGSPVWVFHIDGDEIVRLDDAALAACPEATGVVSLAVRETVSRWDWAGEPTLFKRPLDQADLDLLVVMGVIDEPDNRVYFHGHVKGKSGVRPSVAGLMRIHKVLDLDGEVIRDHRDQRLELFHYESYSGEEFVRKWTTMAVSGPAGAYRPGRASTARSLRHLIGKDLEPAALERVLRRVFETTTQDDVTTLRALGVLVETDPAVGDRRPTPIPPERLAALREGLSALRGQPKDHLYVADAVRAVGSP